MLRNCQLITPTQAAITIGKKLKQHRVARGVTQKEMADRICISPSTLKRIETHGQGSFRDVMALVIELGIDHDILSSIPMPPLRSLDDLDNEGYRIERVRVRAPKKKS